MEEDEEDAYPRTPDEEEINLNSLLPPKSGKSEKKSDEDIADRSSLVHPVLEGLRGDAFLVARDMGLDALAAKGGLDERVERIRKMVFPGATKKPENSFAQDREQEGH